MLCFSGLQSSKRSSKGRLIHSIRVRVNDEVKSTDKELKIPFDVNSSGKVLDSMGRDIEKINEPVTAEDYKEVFSKQAPINPFTKKVPNGQVFTGSIAIDFTDPIPVGSFAYLRGNNNTGNLLRVFLRIY